MTEVALIATEADYRRLSSLYARAMDRNLPQLLADVLTADVVVTGPGFRQAGLDQVMLSPSMLQDFYALTQHVVHNQTLDIDGDVVRGETYCTASHIFHPQEGVEGRSALIWFLRYSDLLRKVDGAWRIDERTLEIDFSEIRPISLGAG